MKKYLFVAFLAAITLHSLAQNTDSSSAPSAPPHAIFENQEWIDYRVYNADRKNHPRILLVGDSISGHYFNGLADALKDKANVSRMGSSICCCDPSYLDTIKLALGQHKYDVIYFNNGIHGPGYTEAQYEWGLEQLVAFLKANAAPDAKLIWASSTQMRDGPAPFNQFQPMNDRVVARNKIAAQIMAQNNIPIDDLYAFMLPHHDLLSDGVHYSQAGQDILTKHVTETISSALDIK